MLLAADVDVHVAVGMTRGLQHGEELALRFVLALLVRLFRKLEVVLGLAPLRELRVATIVRAVLPERSHGREESRGVGTTGPNKAGYPTPLGLR